ncbi:RNA polymerase II mediator complex subunit [Coniosporium apollinis]|uniref:Mediator of RNA polymerase II transcription subunit 12 n=1 Tax=Coniosporium apollinis TaxID=61459 RepID=A0ABQ9NTW1_9PEZI|nr:RNA polymerase II mediator complex subunit [Coniosporium apollinis]
MGSHEITVNAGMVSDREYGQRNGQAKPETSAEGSLSIALASSQGSSAPIRDAYEDASRLAITASAQLPARPGRHGNEHASKSNSMTSTNYEMKQDRAVEALAIQTPHEATRFPSGKNVDFYPWTGEHAEDSISEHVIRSGYFEQQKPNLNESQTARPSLWGHLKNKSGLHTMSSLLVALLEKRQATGRVSATSTFKPPPRVTFKDKRREEWLHDLANPTVTLRLLSRTIPHGLRGKGLLEQCLSKNIPSSRAVWLVKCVGANEMRAFKRKGYAGVMGSAGELKWIREWTTHVEQFVDNAIEADCDETWKAKMTYTIRLASHLFSERLVDHEHYLNWLLASFEGSGLDRIPIWLLLIRIHWENLVSRRQHGWRLAGGLLHHLEVATSHDDPETHPECLIAPKVFDEYKHLLILIADQGLALECAFRLLENRNTRISPQNSRVAHQPSPKKKLVDYLDAPKHAFQLASLASDVLEMVHHWEEAAEVVLHWASSAYRQGHHRLYLATGLLRDWRAKGLDTDGVLLRYLSRVDPRSDIEERNLFRIVVELAWTKDFFVGRYLRYLISIGAHEVGRFPTGKAIPCITRLIYEFSIPDLPPPTLYLRNDLMDGMDHTDEAELELLAAAKTFIAQHILIFSNSVSKSSTIDFVTLSKLTFSARLNLSRWLRAELLDRMTHSDLQTTNSGAPTYELVEIEEYPEANPGTVPFLLRLTGEQFKFVRDVIEQLEDFSVLANILEVAVNSSNSAILCTIAETLADHVEVFSVMGALGAVSRKLFARCTQDDAEDLIDRELYQALSELSCRIDIDVEVIQQLSGHMVRYGQKNTNPVCSPASERTFELPTAMEAISDEAFEWVAKNTTGMDEHRFRQIFDSLIARTCVQHAKNERANAATAPLLRRLRDLNSQLFNQLLYGWLSGCLQDTHGNNMRPVITALVAAGCLDLAEFVRFANRRTAEVVVRDAQKGAMFALRALEAVLPSECASELGKVQAVLNDAHKFATVFGIGSNAKASLSISKMVQDLTNGNESLSAPKAVRLRRIVESVDEISLPFCQLQLRQTLAEDGPSSETAESETINTLFEAISGLLDKDQSLASLLLDSLEQTYLRKIGDVAKWKVLSAVPNWIGEVDASSLPPSAPSFRMDKTTIKKYLVIVHYSTSSSKDDDAQFTSALMQKLRTLVGTLVPRKDANGDVKSQGRSGTTPADKDVDGVITCSFQLMSATADAQTQVRKIHARNVLWDTRLSSIFGSSPDPDGWLSLSSSPHLLTERTSNPKTATSTEEGHKSHVGIRSQQGRSMAGAPPTSLPISQGSTNHQQHNPPAVGQQSSGSSTQRITPFVLRRWEILPDSSSNTGANDTALNLGLFGARKV